MLGLNVWAYYPKLAQGMMSSGVGSVIQVDTLWVTSAGGRRLGRSLGLSVSLTATARSLTGDSAGRPFPQSTRWSPGLLGRSATDKPGLNVEPCVRILKAAA